ncbi:transglutaminase-like domain-containing protein [Ruminococcaceae bacterium OttesenSCG-928-L11]|nr:transglutaminase-like domain-containing protein [Ruminococcaceae bacterium OttesenSCG-928-L11]
MAQLLRKGLALVLCVICLLAAVMPAQALSSTDPRIDIVNGAELDAKSPRSQALDEYLDQLIPEILEEYAPLENEDEERDAFTQLMACYDYLLEHCSYGSHMRNLGASIGSTTCRKIYQAYGELEGFGAVALSANTGLCNAYASAFILMARKIGFNAYLVKGQTKRSGGGYTHHEWAEIEIDGIAYAFDPQLDQSFGRSGLGQYTLFCRTYEEIPGRYVKY